MTKSNFCKALMIGFITLLLFSFTSRSAHTETTIRIGYLNPWTAGHSTIGLMTRKFFPKYRVELISWPGDITGPIHALASGSLDISILSNNQWFRAINQSLPFGAIAEIGPHLAIINKSVFTGDKEKDIVEFLKIWKCTYLSSDDSCFLKFLYSAIDSISYCIS